MTYDWRRRNYGCRLPNHMYALLNRKVTNMQNAILHGDED